VSDLAEITRDLATGRLSASDQPGIIAREGRNIDSVQQEPHPHKGRLSPFFTNAPARAPVAQAQCQGDQVLHSTVCWYYALRGFCYTPGG